ncbi:Dabb family protein [Halioxenophilus aromaticivorans]
MIKHVVLLRFKTDASKQSIEEFVAEVSELKAKIDVVQHFDHGAAATINTGKFDYGVVAEFASAEDYSRYIEHPAHLALAGKMGGLIDDAASLQFDC